MSTRLVVPSALPSFHDGYLRSVLVNDDIAILGLQQDAGNRFELMLAGVEALQANDFRVGNLSNIIFSLTIITQAKLDAESIDERLQRLFPSPHSAAASEYHDRYTSHLHQVCARIESGEAVIVIITASLGCDLIAVCRSAKLAVIEG